MRLAFVLVLIGFLGTSVGAGGFYLQTVDLKTELAKKDEKIAELEKRPKLPQTLENRDILDNEAAEFIDFPGYSVVWKPYSAQQIAKGNTDLCLAFFSSVFPGRKIVGSSFLMVIYYEGEYNPQY